MIQETVTGNRNPVFTGSVSSRGNRDVSSKGLLRQSKQGPSTYPSLQAPNLPQTLILHLEHLLPHRDKCGRSCRAGGSGDHPMPRRYSSLSRPQQRMNLNPASCGNTCSHHPFLHRPHERKTGRSYLNSQLPEGQSPPCSPEHSPWDRF